MNRSVGCGPLGGVVFGAIFAIIGYVVAFYFGKPILDDAKASRSWPSVSGVIERSEVVTSTSNGKTMYGFDVVYRYQVEGRDLTSNNVFFGGNTTSSSSSFAHNVVARYPKGAKVKVFYDPNDPSKAVLEPGTTWQSYLVFGIGLAFLIVGVLVFISSVFYVAIAGLIIGSAVAGWIGSSARRSQVADRFNLDGAPAGPQAPADRRTETTPSSDDGIDIG